MAQNQYFSLQYDSQEKLYVLSIDNISSFSISDIYKKYNDSKVFSKGKNDEIIIHEPIKIKCNNRRKNIKIDFQCCIFEKRVYFTNCTFNANVFFNHAVFHKYADFHESIFNGIVSFYNATFKSAPNFSTCVFANLQGTNFINVKIESLDFDKVKDFIKEYKNDKTCYKELELLREKYSKRAKKLKLFKANCQQESKKYRENKQKLHSKYQGFKQGLIKIQEIRYASNARDSFRTIKNVLIENNNLLDASNWHKLELYAKEIELRLPEPESTSNQNNKYKKCIDLIQLCLYRHTSEHHTDLLKILSWFIILVGSFATILFFERDFFDKKIWCSILWGVLSVALCFSILFEKIKFFRFFTLLKLVPCVWLLTWNPKYIFGVANLFTNDKCQSDWLLNLILSLYSIFFILLVFSLQKTARKNSIIPN